MKARSKRGPRKRQEITEKKQVRLAETGTVGKVEQKKKVAWSRFQIDLYVSPGLHMIKPRDLCIILRKYVHGRYALCKPSFSISWRAGPPAVDGSSSSLDGGSSINSRTAVRASFPACRVKINNNHINYRTHRCTGRHIPVVPCTLAGWKEGRRLSNYTVCNGCGDPQFINNGLDTFRGGDALCNTP